MRILVLEDSLAVARLVESGLKAEGFTLEAGHGLKFHQPWDFVPGDEPLGTAICQLRKIGERGAVAITIAIAKAARLYPRPSNALEELATNHIRWVIGTVEQRLLSDRLSWRVAVTRIELLRELLATYSGFPDRFVGCK